jgi:hypothetical protein
MIVLTLVILKNCDDIFLIFFLSMGQTNKTLVEGQSPSNVFLEQPWPGPPVHLVYTMETGSVPVKKVLFQHTSRTFIGTFLITPRPRPSFPVDLGSPQCFIKELLR